MPPVGWLPSPRTAPLHLQPGVIHGWWVGRAHGGCADVADDPEGLSQGVVHPQHLVTVLRLLLRLLHQGVLVSAGVQLCQQLGINEFLSLHTEMLTKHVNNQNTVFSVSFY